MTIIAIARVQSTLATIHSIETLARLRGELQEQLDDITREIQDSANRLAAGGVDPVEVAQINRRGLQQALALRSSISLVEARHRKLLLARTVGQVAA